MKKEHFGFSHLSLRSYLNADGRTNHIELGSPCNFFAVIETGHAEFCTPYAKIELYPGELLYIPKGLVYTSIWHGEGGCRFYSLGFTFSHLGENARFDLQKLSAEALAKMGLSEEHFSLALSNSARESAFEDAAALRLVCNTYLAAAPHLTARQASACERALRPALSLLEGDPATDTDVPTLSRLCGMSPSGFYAAFKRVTGQTPITYKNLLRARLAVSLLTDTDMSVEEIAARVGCSSASYLRRILADTLGKTPKEIRKERLTL